VAISRTAKGTATDKSLGKTLQVDNVVKSPYAFIGVCIVYDNSQGDPSVRWGIDIPKNQLLLVPGSLKAHGLLPFSIAHWRIKTGFGDTRNLRATWSANIAARAMFVYELSDVERKDVVVTRIHNNTDAPNTSTAGNAPTTTNLNTFHVAAFGSIGPESDSQGVAGSGHILGQRAGTTGAPAASNVTIQETFDELSATGQCWANLTGATSRDWINTIVAFESPSKEEDLLILQKEWETVQARTAAIEANHGLDVALQGTVATTTTDIASVTIDAL